MGERALSVERGWRSTSNRHRTSARRPLADAARPRALLVPLREDAEPGVGLAQALDERLG